MKQESRFVWMILGFLFLVVSCHQDKTKKEGKISGKLANAKKIMVYLERFTDQGEQYLDSTITDENGKFELRNKATEKVYYGLRTDPTNLVYLLINGNENVEINGDAKNLEKTYTISGSEDSELIRELKNRDTHLTDSLNEIYAQVREKFPYLKDSAGISLQQFYQAQMQAFAKEFISKHPKSLVALSATKYLDKQKDIRIYDDLLVVLSKEYPGNNYLKEFENIIVNLKKLPVGSPAPDIVLNSPDGKSIALSSLKGKIVLIDFWASWCGPCRRENPMITEIYRKYKDRKFEIFGVSLDDDVDAWKEAIKKDHITWPQVSELKKWESEVVKIYQIEAIPYTVLIDKQGNIIAKDLPANELEQKLVEELAAN